MATKYNTVESDAMKALRLTREKLDERNSSLTMEEIWEHERQAKEKFLNGTNIRLIEVKPPPSRAKNNRNPKIEAMAQSV